MYERFTDRSRKIMQLAAQEANRFGHETIGTEHILLGLVAEGHGVAACILKELGVELDGARKEVEKLIIRGPGMFTSDRLPQTPQAKMVIEYAYDECQNLGHNYVGSEHILLGLLREEEGIGVQVLRNVGLRPEQVREEVFNLLGHGIEKS